ncbi:MAG TPA: aldehyde dehydrogenase family protein [Polyangiaceae bacterium LLY-WYZ-15_(1-7)]|nr:aldehyde dehydrogenase family protein [Myxococcales bacterium]MAT28047.1 aldehyde dehydrogenase family protein [Sandaracinus sp.]HJK92592.1 aldehyde dehydrogenase family protein [Polyangiaceae bacterium LLY-WYZ-15_(1-7)]MBJ71709.1 aldehyde dehydrogenase family protein [Sandaracinus sp.]HJL06533.1 aldehyde dehydrogenase family protein [Polyangiaceae bacterium LLY-WYZ-15_(1-7)]
MTLSHVSSGPERPEDVLDAIPDIVASLRERYETGVTHDLDWRLRQLDGIARFVSERERDILDALHADVGKPEMEAYGAEVSYVANDVAHVKKHLRDWMKPEKVPTPLITQPGSSRIVREPLGVVLIISPWNYPFQLLMAPLVGAIAAGNCALLKPSEVAPHTSALFARWLPRYLDESCIRVIEGGVPETTKILEQRFDHIFYTGNGVVGRIVMGAAAKHLTPVTLELGGKSPCIVDATADLDVAAKRIVWGKFFNAGQTCVAPDYILVEESVHDALLTRLAATVREFYGDEPQSSPDFARIVNARHHGRLLKLLERSGTVVCGGEHDVDDRYIAPTILKDVPHDAPVMQEEIFGPILPVLSVPHVDAAITFVNQRPKPLALYCFSSSKKTQQKVQDRTSSGGMTINHVWMHLAVPELPFGGVGESGMGAYHGSHSFETFSHRKAVLKKPTQVDPPILYPPYTDGKQKWVKRLL